MILKEPLWEFIELGDGQHLYTPPQSIKDSGTPFSTTSTVHPGLIIFCSWLFAAPRHMAKYTSQYQLLYPRARILLLQNNLHNTSWLPDSVQMQTLRPSVAAVQDFLKMNSVSLREGARDGGDPIILLHAFSNGGTHIAVQLAQSFREAVVNSPALPSEIPFSALILDSCPGKAAFVAGVFGAIKLYLHRGAGAYICGEETALMNSIEGKRGNPRIKPPFPAAAGVFGMPTTINNVETLAAVPLILKKGAAWYKGLSLSSPKSTGTKLFSVCGHVQRPGNYEVTMGFPLKDLVYDLCGGVPPGRTLKACIPGGSSVPILNREQTESCLLDYEGVVEKGSMLGSGGVIVFDDTTDMVYQIMRLAKFYAHESCAQCTQCREGTAWTVKIMERILAGQGKMQDLDLLLDLSDNMTGKTICVLSDSCAAPVVSGIKKFKNEFEAYITGKRRPVAAD